MEELPISTIVASWGFVAGIIFGATAQKTHFCTMGAISDIVFMGNWNRFRAWMLAATVAMLGTQYMHSTEMIDIGKAIYTTPNLGWLGAILGGLMFGFGMTKAGGCGNKTLVRLGAGNLKSLFVAIVMGICGYMTLRGLFGLFRVNYIEPTNLDLAAHDIESQSIVHLIGAAVGSDPESIRLIIAWVIGLAMLAWIFKCGTFRKSVKDWLSGMIIGILIWAGWYITGVVGFDDFEPTPLFSFTFVSPTSESIQYLMTFTGSTINFGIASVFGIITGAFLMAIATKEFRVEAFSGADDMKSHLVGAILMGVGGIMSLGCTIGQGITGVSTLALGSFIALFSILFGAFWGMKSLEEDSVLGGLRAVFNRD